MIPVIRHSGKGKHCRGSKNISDFQGLRDRGEGTKHINHRENIRVVKLFCVIL
jgi:hypothetical protein